ncbi:MAG: hypothetical protein ABF747_02575 [Bifidobacterium sp.]|uniref:Leucine rich repeat variant domain-containing protein n=1 Tax=Bifidobacterium fermentum TaxID=3059035 RepID=A0AB39UCU4_9BIFI
MTRRDAHRTARHSRRFFTSFRKPCEQRLLPIHPNAGDDSALQGNALDPPKPPLPQTALTACDPATPLDALWSIAHERPELRQWVIANTSATPELLEYIAQAGGPNVARCMRILLDSLGS